MSAPVSIDQTRLHSGAASTQPEIRNRAALDAFPQGTIQPTSVITVSPFVLATRLAAQGYRFRFVGEGEAMVRKPDDTLYTVSLTGESLPLGCSCLAGRIQGRCKHLAIVAAFRPCDAPGCSGMQQYHDCNTIGGPVPVYECGTCHKTTSLQRVYEARRPRR